ncbi:MAG: glutamate racemase [Verrucomicrobiaceae bacterium]|nr:glutamate racemase [Verrucomicrobiaceae bacterium]
MQISAQLPIGVFDSGVGGLSVLKHLRAALPAEDFFYIADSGHAPYGVRNTDFIRTRAFAIGDFLTAQPVKALVVACNTATAAAVNELRARYSVPVIAMEPGIKPAVEFSRSKIIGVLATAGTLESARFFSLINRYAVNAEVITQPCPGLVEAIEANDLSSTATSELLQRYLQPLLERGADTIVLGCTHYPFLREQIASLVSADIAIIETGAAVARELKRRLEQQNLLSDAIAGDAENNGVVHIGTESFWSSGDIATVQSVIRQLWRDDAIVHALP